MICYIENVAAVRPSPEVEIRAALERANATDVWDHARLREFLKSPGAVAYVAINPYVEGVYGKRTLIWAESEKDLTQALSYLHHALVDEH